MLSKGLPEERTSLLDIGDYGLFLREDQSALSEEHLNRWLDSLLKQAFRFACDDEVIGITDEVDT